MAVIKCKMCGGDLNIVDGESVCECEYCGTRQTIPTADNEKKLTLFARANRLRLASEFDKAFGIYENIVAEFPEEAEAYWGLVLCKYGIEYVDDPATGKKIPTCHRSSFDSVMEDEDFDQVMENADPISRKVYREEAKQIEEIRKGILEVSGKEEPYDIFICYKETDENGDRTLDSVLAQDIYDALTGKGYRVFFARITLEDKLGQEYEPYIFAALNSAKIMLAVGTDYEYYNAVWVKNEWSRYLKLMAKDKDKHLIPCYKNLDAYDIPKEFVKLQAQDLGKVGATQDLLRGIEKLLGGGSAAQDTKPEQQTVVVKAEAPGVESLLKRADMFLEDGEWDNAKEYYNRVLDIDPQCAKAYLGLNLSNHSCKNMDMIARQRKVGFFVTNEFHRAEQYADAEMKDLISDARAKLTKEIEASREAERKESAEKANKLMPIRQKLKVVTNGFISAGSEYTVGIGSNGHVYTVGFVCASACDVSKWRDIISVSAGSGYIVGLKSDGTAVATGFNRTHRCELEDWSDIVAISTANHTVGLRKDGTVLAKGRNLEGQCDVAAWKNIVAISAGGNHTVGLRNDGTVIAAGENRCSECDVSEWRDIVAIGAGYSHTVGLRKDGTVVAVGHNNWEQCCVEKWKDIVAISAGSFHTLGLCSDGTVIATGKNESGDCDVLGLHGIVAISGGSSNTIALQSNGKVVALGSNYKGQCEVSAWKLFDNVETIEQEQKAAHEQYIQEEKRREEEERIAEERRKEQERIAEERRKEEARKAEEKRQLEEQRRSQGLCPYCGGTFKGLFMKKCSQCGKPKDY